MKSSSSFTLIELIMVIVIIGVIAAIVVPRFMSYREEALITAEKATISAVQRGIAVKSAEEQIE